MLNLSQQRLRWLTWGLLVALFVLMLHFNLGKRIDDSVMDSMLSYFSEFQTPSDELLLIDIDDNSLNTLTHFGKWPWPRSVLADTTEQLMKSGAKAVVFDILFSERDVYRKDDDDYFVSVMNQYDNVYFSGAEVNRHSGVNYVLLSDIESELQLTKSEQANPDALGYLIYPRFEKQQKWTIGSITLTPDSDGIIRHYDVFRNIDGWRWKSLPALVSEHDNQKQHYSQCGSSSCQSIRLKWMSPNKLPYQSLSFVDVFSHFEHGQSELFNHLFKDKIVVIGTSATGLFDFKSTPIDLNYPAVSILMTAIDNLKNNDSLRTLPDFITQVAYWIIFALLTFVCLFSQSFKTIYKVIWPLYYLSAMLLLSLSFILLFSNLLVNVAFLVLCTFTVLLVTTVIKGIQEFYERQQLVGLFGRFMDPRVVTQLMADESLELSTSSKSCEVTVLFSDIRGFTTLSENRSAEEIVTLLNRYFTLQVKTIFKYGGTLDKFIGDAVMAFWGAPMEDPDQALNAVKAAKEMTENLTRFRSELPDELNDFDIGIGIHTGNSVVGMIGSELRYDYTVIGDTVNLASRIEGLTKNRTRVLVSHATYQLCLLNGGNTFEFSEEGDFEVKGRKEKVSLYRLVDCD